MRALALVPHLLYRVAAIIGVAALVVMTSIVCLNIGARALFNASFSWSEELSRFLMIWSAMCGAAMAVRKGAHFRIDLATQFGIASRWITKLPAMAAIAIGLLLAVQGKVLLGLAAMQLATATPMPMSYPYAALPFAGVLMVVFGVEALWSPGPPAAPHAAAESD